MRTIFLILSLFLFSHLAEAKSNIAVGAGFGCKLNAKLSHGLECKSEPSAAKLINLPNDIYAPSLVTAGEKHICVLDNQKVKCWGDNSFGQIDVPANLLSVTALAAGKGHTCAISSGVLRCWGDNSKGQNNVPLDIYQPMAVATGDSHTCAVNGDGAVRCWGLYRNGERADYVPPTFERAVELSAGENKSCVIGHDDQIYCWGASDSDNLINSTRFPNDWYLPHWSVKNVKVVSTSFSGTCFVDDNGHQCTFRRTRDGWPVVSTYYRGIATDVALGNGYVCFDGDIGFKCASFEY